MSARKEPPLNDETACQIQSQNPVTIRILKRRIDWKQDIKQEGQIFYKNRWYPAILYGDIKEGGDLYDRVTANKVGSDVSYRQAFNLFNPRIHCRKFNNSYRISISILDNSYIDKTSVKTLLPEDILEKAREMIRAILLKDNELRSAFIACGLFLGEKEMIPEPVQKRINRSGISHLFAVSGLHVGFIVLLFTLLLKLFGTGIRTQMVLICLFSFLYAFLTPFSSSIFRTVLMLLLFSITRLCDRKIHILHIVFSSALIMLNLTPIQISQVGFWFSYLAVLGILIFYPVLSKRFHIKNRLLRYVWEMVLVSASATWGIFPAGILVFGTVSTLAVFLNILMIPLVFLMLGTIIIKVLFAWIPFLGQGISWAYSVISAVFFTILETVYPYSEYLVYTIRNIPLTGALWLAGTLFFFNIPRKRVHKLYLFTAITLLSFIIPFTNRFMAVSSESDNSIFLVNRKNILMVNGTSMNSFDNFMLKRFRLTGRKPAVLIVTDAYHNDNKNIMTLQKQYPGMQVLAPASYKASQAETVKQDTLFSFGNMEISLFLQNNRLNIYIHMNGIIVGILEYPPHKPANLFLSRKKYSEIRSGTDKFLTARIIDNKEEMISIVESSNLKEPVKIW